MGRRNLAATVTTAAAIAAGLFQATDGGRAFTAEGARRLAVAESPRPVPRVRLLDHEGRDLDNADLPGRASLVQFIYTRCPTVCGALQARFAPLPIFGVVEPGADAAAERGGSVALLATESTVRQGAYQRALLCRGVARVRARAAPLLVALAEEGATELQATILQLLGLDPNGLSYFFGGLDQKLGPLVT